VSDWQVIEIRAADWIAERDRRLQDGSWTAQREAALGAWLDAATAHRVAYLRLDAVWRRADRMQALRPLARPPVQFARLRNWVSQIRPSWRGLAAVPMLLILFVGAGLWVRETAMPANSGLTEEVFVTERGGRTPLALADGSRVTLNTATRLRTAITPTLRSVWLDEGEAHFEITHDPKRPFEVIVGAQRVRVLGTTFSVRREPNGLRVSVLEGRVQLDRDRGNRRILLTRGDVALANDQHVVIGKRSARQLLDELGWLEGKLIFDQASLADVALEFNRYSTRQLLVDETAARIQVGGAFDATNVEGFARLLHAGFGLDIRVGRDEIRVSSPPR
jgi:transmembrane sensor